MTTNDEQTKRQAERVTINREFASFDAFMEEYVTNISRSGVYVRSKSPLPKGTKVNLRFTVIMDDIEVIEGTGEVVRVDEQGMGVVFRELSNYSKQLIERLLRGLIVKRLSCSQNRNAVRIITQPSWSSQGRVGKPTSGCLSDECHLFAVREADTIPSLTLSESHHGTHHLIGRHPHLTGAHGVGTPSVVGASLYLDEHPLLDVLRWIPPGFDPQIKLGLVQCTPRDAKSRTTDEHEHEHVFIDHLFDVIGALGSADGQRPGGAEGTVAAFTD